MDRLHRRHLLAKRRQRRHATVTPWAVQQYLPWPPWAAQQEIETI
jgi:hypothetical protein